MFFGKTKAIVKENEVLTAANKDLVATNKEHLETIEALKRHNRDLTARVEALTGDIETLKKDHDTLWAGAEMVASTIKSEYAHESTLHKKPTEYMRGLKVGLTALEEAGLC